MQKRQNEPKQERNVKRLIMMMLWVVKLQELFFNLMNFANHFTQKAQHF